MTIFDLVDDVGELFDEHEDTIDRVKRALAGDNLNSVVSMGDGDPLIAVHKHPGEISVSVDVGGSTIQDVGFSASDDGVIEVSAGGERLVFKNLPDSVVTEDTDVKVNNGVLTLTIPRSDDNEL